MTTDAPFFVPSPESDVLVACAAAGVAADGDRLRRALARVADWRRLRVAAVLHGMLPLLFRRISELCPDAAPPAFLDDLRQGYQYNSERTLRMTVTLLRIVDRLSAAGVPAVPYKGPVLAEYVYGDVGLRQMSDLDILVRHRDIARAREVLARDGFAETRDARDELALLAAECELILRRPGADFVVELHWRVGPRFAHASLPASELMDRSRPATLLGRDVPSLCPEDLFLMLCLHGAAHSWAALEMVSTLGALLARGVTEDWRRLLDRAATSGCRRRCLVGAAVAHLVTGVDLPAGLHAAIAADLTARRLAMEARARLQHGTLGDIDEGGLRGALWEARTLDGPFAAAVHLVSRAITPGARDWDWVSLPHGLDRLYYVVRPARLATEYARRVVRSD